jgi:hypothetical protein
MTVQEEAYAWKGQYVADQTECLYSLAVMHP